MAATGAGGDAGVVAAAPARLADASPAARALGPLVERWFLVLALAVLLAVCAIVFPQFRTAGLFSTMLNAQSLVLMLALTATLVLRGGDFDLSISQNMVASAAVVVLLAKLGLPLPVAMAGGLLCGVLIGALNALLVVRIGVDSFVATLGSYTLLAGLAYLLTDSRVVTGVPAAFVAAARSKLGGLPLITWYAWGLAVALWYVYEKTPLGRYMLFIGGSRPAARLGGIPVDAIRAGAYVASGALAACIGVLFAGYFGAIDPGVGGQFMLQPFAAAFLGATTLCVGRFNAFGTLAALYLLTVGITGLQLLGAETWVTNVFYGAALMGAVTAARLAGNRARGGSRP